MSEKHRVGFQTFGWLCEESCIRHRLPPVLLQTPESHGGPIQPICTHPPPTSPSLDHLPANTWYFHVTNSPAAHNWPAKWPETTYSAASPLCGAWTTSRSKLCLIDPICSPRVHMRAPPPPLRRPLSMPHCHCSEPKNTNSMCVWAQRRCCWSAWTIRAAWSFWGGRGGKPE